MEPPSIEFLEAARERLSRVLKPTPLVAGGSLFLKLETQQPTGSFKVRPAFNGVLSRLDEARARGVVTSSSGNFAQAVAFAAKTLGVRARIVMMRGASEYKRDRAAALGAEIVSCDDTFEARWETTWKIKRESGALLLHPYDSDETIAGDATLGLELLDQTPGDFCVVAPVSGGGLISGIAAAVKARRPRCRVVGVQAAANPAMLRSIAAGERVEAQPETTLADALTVARPGERTFAIARRLTDQMVAVGEEAIADAVRRLAIEHKLVVEGGGAVGFAAWSAGLIETAGLPVVCVLSGGNIHPARLAQVLTAAER